MRTADGETHTLTAPADGAVEYADTLFTNHFRGDNVYVRDPAEEVDNAWTTLYDGSVILRVYSVFSGHAYSRVRTPRRIRPLPDLPVRSAAAAQQDAPHPRRPRL